MIFTFYSYKGGVGRSMAMANVADTLARQGLRVAMIDFDLEAPGLEEYFPVDHSAVRRHGGLLDLLLAYKRAMSGTGPEDAFTRLDDFLFPIYPRLPGGGRLDLLPAGRRGDVASLSRYATELQRFDWQDFFFNWAGSRLFEWLRRKLGQRYDVVLVDSRTGVTEMGGVCAYQLADVIVAVCAANRQNVEGTASTLADFTSPRVRAQRADRPLQIVVVPSRVEVRATEELARFKARFASAFNDLQPEGIDFWSLLIPYEPRWAFDEASAGRIDARGGASPVYQPLTQVLQRLAGVAGTATRSLAGGPQGRAAGPGEAGEDDTQVDGQPAVTHRGGHGAGVGPASAAPDAPRVRGVITQAPLAVEPVGDGPASEPPAAHPAVADPPAADATAADSEPSEGARSRLSFDPTRSVAPADALLVHAPQDVATMRDLEVALRRLAVRTQRLSVPADAGRGWADAARWATRSTFRVVLYDPRALGQAGERLADLAEAPVVRVARDDGDLFGTLHRALVGEPPPDDDAVRRAVAEALRPVLDESSVSGPSPVQNPYVGHRAYDEADAGWFFGRDTDLKAIVERLRQHPVVTVTGPSGAGKSSLLRAGLLPEVRGGALGVGWQVAVVEATETLDVLAAIDSLRAGHTGSLLVVLDDAQRLPTEALDALVQRAGGGLTVLLAIQASDPQAARGDTYVLRPLRREDMHRAMLAAADRAGVNLEEGLAERILDDLELVATPLSALQAILRELFLQRRQGFLTHAAYAYSGHASGQTSADAAERVFIGLSDEVRQAARAMCLRLVTADGELRTVGLDSLPEDSPIEAFVAARVLWAGVRADGMPAWRISDARLPGRWARLTDWLADEVEFVRWVDFVHTAQQAGTVVLTWNELARAEQIAEERRLAPAELSFLEEARAWEARKAVEEAERARRKRWAVAAGGIMAVAVLCLALLSVWMRGDAARSEARFNVANAVRLEENLDNLEEAHAEAAARYAQASADGDLVAEIHYGTTLANLDVQRGDVKSAERVVRAVETKLPDVRAEGGDEPEFALARERLAKAKLRLADADWLKTLVAALLKAEYVLIVDVAVLADGSYSAASAAQCPPSVVDERGRDLEVERVEVAGAPVVLRPDWDSLVMHVENTGGRLVLLVPERGPWATSLVKQMDFAGRALNQSAAFAGVVGDGELSWLAEDRLLTKTVVVLSRDVPFSQRNTRSALRFDADIVCGGVSVADPAGEMRRLVAQMDDSLNTGLPFAEAFLPYTSFGIGKVSELMESQGLTREEAVQTLRARVAPIPTQAPMSPSLQQRRAPAPKGPKRPPSPAEGGGDDDVVQPEPEAGPAPMKAHPVPEAIQPARRPRVLKDHPYKRPRFKAPPMQQAY